MNEVSQSFEFRGLLCFARQSAPDSYYFAPLHADLDRDPEGRPLFSLITIGAKGYLMLTAVWRATDKALQALRKEIATRVEIDDPATIELLFAPAKVAKCDLLLGDGSGHFQTLASSSTSGMPPYPAVFGVSLTEEQFARAAAAVNGRVGFMAIEYDVQLSTHVRASARLVPQSVRFISWLRTFASGDQAPFRSALEAAIEDGLATVSVSLPNSPTNQLIARLYERLLTQATTVLPRMISSWNDDGIAELEVVVELVEESSQPMRPLADLAGFAFDPSHITLAGSATPSTERTARTSRPLQVRLGFHPAGAPLAWVRVCSGDAEAVLKPPHFDPVELAGKWQAGQLIVAAGFTNGVHNHSLEIEPPGETQLSLSAEQLGLRMLTVNARPLADAGIRSAEMSLRYRPPHRPDEQRQTIRFHDDAWASHWWVVTTTSSWLHYVDYSWTAIIADGRVAGQSVTQTGSSEIILSLPEGATHVTNR